MGGKPRDFIKAKAPGGRTNYSWWGGGEEQRFRLIQHFLTKVTGEGEATAYRREDKKTSLGVLFLNVVNSEALRASRGRHPTYCWKQGSVVRRALAVPGTW